MKPEGSLCVGRQERGAAREGLTTDCPCCFFQAWLHQILPFLLAGIETVGLSETHEPGESLCSEGEQDPERDAAAH